jgi:hypothetical protein
MKDFTEILLFLSIIFRAFASKMRFLFASLSLRHVQSRPRYSITLVVCIVNIDSLSVLRRLITKFTRISVTPGRFENLDHSCENTRRNRPRRVRWIGSSDSRRTIQSLTRIVRAAEVVGLGRVELPTHGLGNRCSIHLSYRPATIAKILTGFSLSTQTEDCSSVLPARNSQLTSAMSPLHVPAWLDDRPHRRTAHKYLPVESLSPR